MKSVLIWSLEEVLNERRQIIFHIIQDIIVNLKQVICEPHR